MKPKKLKLKKSAQDKRRYFVTNAKSNKEIEKALLDYIGILGFAKAAYKQVKDKALPKNKITGSCLREELHNVRSALTFAEINIEKVATTIKGLTTKEAKTKSKYSTPPLELYAKQRIQK